MQQRLVSLMSFLIVASACDDRGGGSIKMSPALQSLLGTYARSQLECTTSQSISEFTEDQVSSAPEDGLSVTIGRSSLDFKGSIIEGCDFVIKAPLTKVTSSEISNTKSSSSFSGPDCNQIPDEDKAQLKETFQLEAGTRSYELAGKILKINDGDDCTLYFKTSETQ